jgi:hypothetical protein
MRKLTPINVVSDAEAEAADYLLCVRLADDPGLFPDNVLGACCACGLAVVFRPHSPKRPPRLCLQCAAALGPAPH